MGFFGKLFEKKECDICGGEIGLLGNRKLEDGNLCKNCANKLSPWFDDRRNSTVEQIREQLEYREENKNKVAAFNVTRSIGEKNRVLIDEDARTFMVVTDNNYKESNPDVINCIDVIGCRVEIDDCRTEEKRQDKDGKFVSYNPPRYRYTYNFDIVIDVRHPYFDDIKFRLNKRGVDVNVQGSLFGASQRPTDDPEYRHYLEMAEEIKEVLLSERKNARERATASKVSVVCPYCGATTTPDASGCCEYCGGAVKG